MTERVPIDYVEGVEEVTVWMWPNTPDPLTVRFDLEEWEAIEAKAEEVADGDVEVAIGRALASDIGQYFDTEGTA
jgi:hypothetical protein